MIKQYRKKPVVIEAVQWTGTNFGEILRFTQGSVQLQNDDDLWVNTLEGGHTALNGDFIIKGIQGEFYPCKPDIFKETYEEVV